MLFKRGVIKNITIVVYLAIINSLFKLDFVSIFLFNVLVRTFSLLVNLMDIVTLSCLYIMRVVCIDFLQIFVVIDCFWRISAYCVPKIFFFSAFTLIFFPSLVWKYFWQLWRLSEENSSDRKRKSMGCLSEEISGEGFSDRRKRSVTPNKDASDFRFSARFLGIPALESQISE